jgi:hypothetical protein
MTDFCKNVRRAFVIAFVLIAGTICAVSAATAAVVDWEQTRPTPRTDTGDYSPYVNPQFTSSKSLSATTNWLKSALERYGDVPRSGNQLDAFRVSNVRFAGCTMQWVENRSVENGGTVIEDAYTLGLRDVGRGPGDLQVLPNGLTVGLSASSRSNPLTFIERVQHRDGGTVTSSQSSRSDNSFTVTLQNKDDIARRIGTALIHAARLCSTG